MQADVTLPGSDDVSIVAAPAAKELSRRMNYWLDRLRLRASEAFMPYRQRRWLPMASSIGLRGRPSSPTSAPVSGPAPVRTRHAGVDAVRRVLIVDAHYPRDDCDSGSLRMLSMLTLLRDLGCHVQFWATGGSQRDAYAGKLEQLGIELVVAPARADGLRWWFENGRHLDMVVLSRLPVALASVRLAKRYAKNAAIIFDTVDLHFLRIARGAALQANKADAAWARELRVQELGVMRRVHLTLVVSAYEQRLLRDLAPSVPVTVLSNIHGVHGRQGGFAGRSGLLFLANFEHAPNVDAAHWLIEHVMPKLRARLRGVMLHIVGYAADKMLVGDLGDDVLVHGHVADLAPVMRKIKVAVAPLRYGAGVKGKINMAMSYGIPVVTTSVGAEGMSLLHRCDAMIADGSEDFAQAIAEAHNDEALWLSLSDRGLDNVGRHFSADLARQTLTEILRLSTRPPPHPAPSVVPEAVWPIAMCKSATASSAPAGITGATSPVRLP